MYNVTSWEITTPTFVSSYNDADDCTACKFDEEADILHIGQMLADLWERVGPALSRDAYNRLGGNGLERGSATNEIISAIVGSSGMFIDWLA